MTNKQKWDIALQEYIHESDILEKAISHFSLFVILNLSFINKILVLFIWEKKHFKSRKVCSDRH